VTEAKKGELFFFNCEEFRHIEIECPYLNIENDEIEYNTEIEKKDLINDLYELKKEREENKLVKTELMKQEENVQSFEESQHVIKNLRAQLE
jgi:hypothetical protein